MTPKTLQHLVPYILLLIASCTAALFFRVDAFQSAGTLVQLQTSHVPTLEDVRARRREQKRIHQDLIDLTGY